jgi:UDP-N-acetylmuramyl pentapeptide synthase
VAVGELARGYLAGYRGEVRSVATPEEARALLKELAGPGDRVLVKGSRSVGLERVLA